MVNAIDNPRVMFPYLSSPEAAVYRWQYDIQGGFLSDLWKAIAAADETNLDRLAKGFPIQVEGYRSFRADSAWWTAVKEKVERQTDGPAEVKA